MEVYSIIPCNKLHCWTFTTTLTVTKPGRQRVQALADISRSGYVVIATKPVHRLQIRPTVHN